MFEEELKKTVAEAQRAPAEDYMLWAEIEEGKAEITLQTVRLPLAFSAEVSLSRLKTVARTSLASAGYHGAEADAVRIHLERLPSVEEIKALLDPIVASGEEMVFLDLTYWEAARSRLHLERRPAEFGDEFELHYNGLKIRRSATS